MNSTDQSSRPLELRPWLWMSLGMVAAIGLSTRMADRNRLQTLDHLDELQPAIVRMVSGRHEFPLLGIRLAPPPGWIYLSASDDLLASEPTFVHLETASIVSLRNLRFRAWPPGDSKIASCQYVNVTIEWAQLDHRMVGRLTADHIDVCLLALTHAHKPELNRAIEELCQAIEIIEADD